MLNEEWLEMGKSLQTNFHRNQKRFWKRVTNKNESRELGAMCDENGVVIADEERGRKNEIDRMWGQG